MVETVVVENIKIHILYSVPFSDNRSVFCWKTKATDTHSEYVILIACPRQMWLQESDSMVRYTCTAYLIIS